MNDIAAFLQARLDEAERRERGKYKFGPFIHCPECLRSDTFTQTSGDDFVTFEPCRHTMPNQEFCERFGEPAPDPFVLADIDAKRRIIRAHAKHCEGQCGASYPDAGLDAAYYWAIKVHAAVYANHGDYKESWRP